MSNNGIVMDEIELQRRVTLASRALRALVWPPLILYILLAAPIVGNLVVVEFSLAHHRVSPREMLC